MNVVYVNLDDGDKLRLVQAANELAEQLDGLLFDKVTHAKIALSPPMLAAVMRLAVVIYEQHYYCQAVGQDVFDGLLQHLVALQAQDGPNVPEPDGMQ